MQGKTILQLSIPLAVFVIAAGSIGFFTLAFYSHETVNWQAQSIGQDMIDVFLVSPCLLLTSVFAYGNNKIALAIWPGIVLYLTYTFVIYCFAVHFNILFVVYCICLCLSFYSFLYFLLSNYKQYKTTSFEGKPVFRITGIYFIIIAVIFYLLWLAEIIPSVVYHTTPQSVSDAGLFTNPVHVIDLSVVLPAIFISGIILLKKRAAGLFLAPMMLTFLILMDITIVTLVVVMKTRGLGDSLVPAIIMSVLTILSLALLILFLRNIKQLS